MNALTKRQTRLLFLLFFLSGAAALIYEVLWLKELGRLFGVTAHAAATTLAVFFLGLSAGSFAWGRRARRMRNPLRVYALLEFGIALTALLYFLLVDVYEMIYGPLYSQFGHSPLLFTIIKFLLAVGVLFPPAFLMGGTLPVMGHFLVRRTEQLGPTGSWLYAINTFGAAVGVLLAGFVLAPNFGLTRSYLAAIILNLVAGSITFLWSRRAATPPSEAPSPTEPAPESDAERAEVSVTLITVIAFVSGFATLGLEVLWTRMYAQVLQNSVFTFSIILVIFLLALSLGSLMANFLSRKQTTPSRTLFTLLTLSGLLVGFTPLIFYVFNPDLSLLGTDLGWSRYILAAFGQAVLVLIIPGVAIGSAFPYLMKLSERYMQSAGQTIGRLVAINTIAAIVGSLIAGFLLLDLFGLWSSIRLIAIIYLILALFVRPRGKRKLSWRLAPLAGIVLFAAVLTYEGYAAVTLNHGQGEQIVEKYEGSQGTVVVVRRGDDLRIKINNSYLLGTSGSAINERLQGWLPLCFHPQPKSVFFLGMGTGITAGAALDFDIDSLTVCELNGDVVTASREHFEPYVNGLYSDPRSRVLIEDGRTFLRGTNEKYDVIVADIFLTYRAGVGGLYTVEHFEAIRERLNPEGIFVQWLPLFDFSEKEFGIVARTILEVFPQVTLWRRGFSPRFPVYALVARADEKVMAARAVEEGLNHLKAIGRLSRDVWIQNIPFAAYAGNLSMQKNIYNDYAVNTDDYTILEYIAPVTERQHRGENKSTTFAWLKLAGFCARMFSRVPLSSDPYVSNLTEVQLDQVKAGLAFQQYECYRRAGRQRAANQYYRKFNQLVAPDTSSR